MEQTNMGNSDMITREYFDNLLIATRYIGAVEPTTEFKLYGETFSSPIMTAALANLHRIREDGMVEFSKGVLAANAVHWTGWISNEDAARICDLGTKMIRVVKPFADHDLIYKAIEHDEKCGALAVGMDIDHIFDAKGKYFKGGFGVIGPQTVEDLKGYAASTKLPFILKGILSVQDALACVEIGVGGIVVSHHKASYEYAVPPLMVLPEIVKAVNGKFPIFVDCGIESGIDAFKALAMGATAVGVGRPLMKVFAENGAESVQASIEKMTVELNAIMARTGCADLAHIDSSVIFKK